MSKREVEKRVDMVAGSFAVDGIILTESEKNNIRAVASGEMTHEQVIRMLDRKYKKSQEAIAV